MKDQLHLADQLAQLNKQQLIDLLLLYARDFEQVEQRLTLHFIQPTGADELKQSKALIRSYIKQSSDRHGFVSYRNVSYAITGAEMVLQKALQVVDQGNALRTINISFCVLHEMERLLQCSDDSNGYVGDLLHSASRQYKKRFGQIPYQTKKRSSYSLYC
ncbi:hypothetical protein SD71_03355 [Cohnella kolymensis]|uniref:Uncharacterized protein n=1 Tax=Cohnella kolymensis TaxID=1590652 RepID=A0ABR5A9F9_9BACL|nr:hypothetical protein [Cohnella kolymensis]KIL37648.1 hypothetical protein SD71_03355 [Cohnella kolymensis]